MDPILAFVMATALIVATPGPTVLLVITQAASHGPRSVLPLVAGVLLGDFTAMSLSLLGLGALLATSATLFLAFKWVGAAYLVYLGVRLWYTSPEAAAARGRSTLSGRALMRRSFLVSALNPKGIAFYVAFLPQFIDHQQPAAPQMALLGGIFLALAVTIVSLYAVFASRLRTRIDNPKVRRRINRFGGGALVGAGIFTAGMENAS